MKNKKNIGGIILVVILIFLIIGLISYILIDKNIIKFGAEKEDEIVEEKDKTLSDTEKSKLFALADIIFNDEDSLNVEDIDNQTKLNIALKLNESNFLEISGQQLINTYHDYFGQNQEITLENIKCPGSDALQHTGDAQYLYLYDKNTDSFINNPNHPGHGGGGSAKPYINYKYIETSSVDDDIYKLNLKIYFVQNPCMGDTCLGLPNDVKVYKSYNDAVKEEGYIVDATVNENYCTISETVSNEYSKFYECDYDKIYEGVKDDLNTYTFEFIKENNNLIFKRYYLEK